MRKLRFSIAGLMGVVVVAAVGLAAWRNANETWAGVMMLLTCGVLALAVVGAIYREGASRAWWLGFSVFGWGYMALWTLCYDSAWKMRPTTMVLQLVEPWMWSLATPIGGGMGGAFGGGMGGASDPRWFLLVGQCLWALLAAAIGGASAWFFFASSRDRLERVRAEPTPAVDPSRDRRLLPTILGFLVLILGAAIATVRSGSAPFWAGVTFLLTCVLVGLAILGAWLGRGGRRRSWMGAALFGAGYMALVFCRPVSQPPRAYLATDQILKAMRPWFSSVPRSLRPANDRVLEALERPIPMRFNQETTLGEVLDYIKREITPPGGPGIPIYLDPIGLQEAERSINSTLQIDLEGVPLRTTLALCLKQLGLGYEVKDGFLRIAGEENVTTDLEDPFLIVGHCLLAMVAAGLGALAAPIVAGGGLEDDGRRPDPSAMTPPV